MANDKQWLVDRKQQWKDIAPVLTNLVRAHILSPSLLDDLKALFFGRYAALQGDNKRPLPLFYRLWLDPDAPSVDQAQRIAAEAAPDELDECVKFVCEFQYRIQFLKGRRDRAMFNGREELLAKVALAAQPSAEGGSAVRDKYLAPRQFRRVFHPFCFGRFHWNGRVCTSDPLDYLVEHYAECLRWLQQHDPAELDSLGEGVIELMVFSEHFVEPKGLLGEETSGRVLADRLQSVFSDLAASDARVAQWQSEANRRAVVVPRRPEPLERDRFRSTMMSPLALIGRGFTPRAAADRVTELLRELGLVVGDASDWRPIDVASLIGKASKRYLGYEDSVMPAAHRHMLLAELHCEGGSTEPVYLNFFIVESHPERSGERDEVLVVVPQYARALADFAANQVTCYSLVGKYYLAFRQMAHEFGVACSSTLPGVELVGDPLFVPDLPKTFILPKTHNYYKALPLKDLPGGN